MSLKLFLGLGFVNI